MPDREINSQSSLVALRMEEMPALQAFLYRFPDGDKHIASFTLEMRRINDDVPPRIDPDGRHGEYIFGLRDKDAGERIFGRLSWVDVFDVASATSTCGGAQGTRMLKVYGGRRTSWGLGGCPRVAR